MWLRFWAIWIKLIWFWFEFCHSCKYRNGLRGKKEKHVTGTHSQPLTGWRWVFYFEGSDRKLCVSPRLAWLWSEPTKHRTMDRAEGDRLGRKGWGACGGGARSSWASHLRVLNTVQTGRKTDTEQTTTSYMYTIWYMTENICIYTRNIDKEVKTNYRCIFFYNHIFRNSFIDM